MLVSVSIEIVERGDLRRRGRLVELRAWLSLEREKVHVVDVSYLINSFLTGNRQKMSLISHLSFLVESVRAKCTRLNFRVPLYKSRHATRAA